MLEFPVVVILVSLFPTHHSVALEFPVALNFSLFWNSLVEFVCKQSAIITLFYHNEWWVVKSGTSITTTGNSNATEWWVGKSDTNITTTGNSNITESIFKIYFSENQRTKY
jgi:hypothetical protein